MALKFTPPTDAEKAEWAKSEIIARSELGGNVYELSPEGKVFALERTRTYGPRKPGEVSYLYLTGVIHEPTPTLVDQIKQASSW